MQHDHSCPMDPRNLDPPSVHNSIIMHAQTLITAVYIQHTNSAGGRSYAKQSMYRAFIIKLLYKPMAKVMEKGDLRPPTARQNH